MRYCRSPLSIYSATRLPPVNRRRKTRKKGLWLEIVRSGRESRIRNVGEPTRWQLVFALFYTPKMFGTTTMKQVCHIACIPRGVMPRNKPVYPFSFTISFQYSDILLGRRPSLTSRCVTTRMVSIGVFQQLPSPPIMPDPISPSIPYLDRPN